MSEVNPNAHVDAAAIVYGTNEHGKPVQDTVAITRVVQMENLKPWWQSIGVWGGVIAILAPIASVFGYVIDVEMQKTLAEWIVTAVSLVGGALALYGRIIATKKLK